MNEIDEKNKKYPIAVYLDKEEKENLRQKAFKMRCSQSNLIKIALAKLKS